MDQDQTVFALLVAIDKYHPDSSVPHLAGCKNDISRINTFFTERIGDGFNAKVLTDENATKTNIIDGFQNHLGKAKEGDSILFYYSGHGSQSMTAREFWRIEPDKLDETIVAYDSRTQNGSDLADKELAYLIDKLAKTKAHITIVMDCCHSGSGTREINGPNVASRRMLTDERSRSQGDRGYFFMNEPGFEPGESKSGSSLSGWIDLPKGDHILLSACRSSETAKEKLIEGERRGIFSHYLLETLQAAGPTMTYRDVFMRTNALVRAEVSEQSPQMDTTGEVSLNQPFLGGAIQDVPEYFSLEFVRDTKKQKDLGWYINGGMVNGIKKTGAETTDLALFDINTSNDDLANLEQALALMKVTAVEPTRSKIELVSTDDFELDQRTTYKAVVTGLPVPPLLVSFEGDSDACELVRTALNTSMGGNASLTVQEASEKDATYKVVAADDAYRISRMQDGYSLVDGTDGFSANSAATIVTRLEHIARWQNLLKLTNPQSQIDPAQIKIKMEKSENNGPFERVEQNSDISLLSMGADEGEEAILKLKVTNKTRQKLFFMFLAFGEAYEIQSLTEGDEINGKWLDTNESFSPFSDLGGIPSYIQADLWEKGIDSYKQTIKLIITTEESYAEYFQQEELPISPTPRTRKVRQLDDTLSRLMDRNTTRAMGRRRGGQRADWTTVEISFTIHQPKGEQLAGSGRSISPTSVISIEGHSGLSGNAEMSSLPAATRSVGNPSLPHIMRDHPDLFRPMELSGTRAGSPGMSVLDLTDVTGAETVTPDNPLKINLDTELAENESLLALGVMDGYFVPLDIATGSEGGKTNLELPHLPSSAVTTRSLKKAVRILFQKYAHKHLGMPYDYPRLARVTVNENGELSYFDDIRDVKKHVAEAKRIALYIHGIIGSTDLMAASSHTNTIELSEPIAGIADSHDLILTFDYENLETPIEEVAHLLQSKLAEAGLAAGHDKTFNIIAHSMGGLVSRWFIEYLGGNKVVNHLVMLGTPNAGSPLPKIEDWLLSMATVALNALAITAWPITALNAIIRGIEKIDVSLDQMAPDSDFLKNLSRSPDPEVPYTIIAGNTSIIPKAIGTEEDKGFFLNLMSRMTSKETTYSIASYAFWQQPNDIAASVKSVSSTPATWEKTIPEVIVVPSDHMSYFNVPAGLESLAEALKE